MITSVHDLDSVQPGNLVLADITIECIPECSLGVLVQMLDAHLAQVVFPNLEGQNIAL